MDFLFLCFLLYSRYLTHRDPPSPDGEDEKGRNRIEFISNTRVLKPRSVLNTYGRYRWMGGGKVWGRDGGWKNRWMGGSGGWMSGWVEEEMDPGVDWAGVVLGPALQEEAGLSTWRHLSLRVI